MALALGFSNQKVIRNIGCWTLSGGRIVGFSNQSWLAVLVAEPNMWSGSKTRLGNRYRCSVLVAEPCCPLVGFRNPSWLPDWVSFLCAPRGRFDESNQGSGPFQSWRQPRCDWLQRRGVSFGTNQRAAYCRPASKPLSHWSPPSSPSNDQ